MVPQTRWDAARPVYPDAETCSLGDCIGPAACAPGGNHLGHTITLALKLNRFTHFRASFAWRFSQF